MTQNCVKPRIGVVLAGGMNKGIYEIGCLQAIEEFFGKDSIEVISASSIGSLIAYSYSVGRTEKLVDIWKNLNVGKTARLLPRMISNNLVTTHLSDLVNENRPLDQQLYITLWNFTKMKAEYCLLNSCNTEILKDYMVAAMTVPIVNSSVRIHNNMYFDGALLDNIPVYPMLNKKVDYIFCIYFDGENYIFESDEFNKKVIKLNAFPVNKRLLDDFAFTPEKTDEMISYGYYYTKGRLQKIFGGDHIDLTAGEDLPAKATATRRCTSDVLLKSLNIVMKRFSNRVIR